MTTLGLKSELLASIPGVSHRFFGRLGGTSPAPWRGLNTSFLVGDVPARVEENLARVRFQVGVGRAALYTAMQVHGDAVYEVHASDDVEQVSAIEADALITSAPDIALGVRTADCAPVLLASEDGEWVAAVHAGWRGAVGGIIGATVAALVARGVSPAALVACIGPCIGQSAFEVGPEVASAVMACAPDGEVVFHGRDDRSHLDLARFVESQLRRAGVHRIEFCASCTYSDLETWYSHRAEGGKTGRQLSVIARTQPPVLSASTFA
ncbi:MAG: peptidoglycan editing factor PgeF [Myxococcota bacterium]